MKKLVGQSWIPADEYGHSLPPFTVNLLFSDLARAARFYSNVLEATIVYSDPDFIALEINGLKFMVHADHTYDRHPWFARLQASPSGRGLGAEMRLLGVDPDAIEARARKRGAVVLQAAQDKPHGWREAIVADADGYAWAVGRVI